MSQPRHETVQVVTPLRRICLVGARGVGKTTLIKAITAVVPHMDIIVGSSVLRNIVGPGFDRFDHLPSDVKERHRENAILWMEERQRVQGRHILCEGHCSLLDESTGAILPVFTERDCGFFSEIILLEESPTVVLANRSADPSKKRCLDPAIITAELAAERDICRRLSELWSMKLHVLPVGSDPTTPLRLLEILR